MRHFNFASALAALSLIAAAPAAHAEQTASVERGTPAAQCTGDACKAVLFEVTGGCFNATNLGGKRIVIEWGGYELKVGPGGMQSVKKDGRCVRNVGGPLTANFG